MNRYKNKIHRHTAYKRLTSDLTVLVAQSSLTLQPHGLSMEFSRQAYQSGLSFPSPGDLLDPGIEPSLVHCRQILYHLSYLRSKDTHRLEVRECKKLFCANGNHMKAAAAILKMDQADFKTKIVTRDKGCYIIIKGSMQEGDKTTVNIYAPHVGPPRHTQQTLRDMKGETDSNTRTTEAVNTPLTLTQR